MTLPFALSWPDFSFWGWLGFFVGAGFASVLLFGSLFSWISEMMLEGIRDFNRGIRMADSWKAQEWKRERHRIASAIVKTKYIKKLDQMRVPLAEEGVRKLSEFEKLVRENREDSKSQYFSQLGMYCGLLSFFRSIKEDSGEGYYRLNVFGVPVVSVHSKELVSGNSAQINESIYLDHSFLGQYIMPFGGHTRN